MAETMTLAQLCQAVSTLIGGYESGTTTAISTTTTVTDTLRGESDGYWTGGWLTVAGVERRILDFTAGVFTTNAFPTTYASGTAYEVRRNPLHRRETIKTHLNMALRRIQDSFWVPVDSVDDLADDTEWTCAQTEYAVPAGLTYVHRLLWQDEADEQGLDDPVYPWRELPHDQWRVIRPGYVTISNYVQGVARINEDAPLRFLGSVRPGLLSAESDVCPVNAQYPLYYAASLTCLGMLDGQDQDNSRDKYAAYMKEAEAARREVRERLPDGSRKVV